MASWARRWVPDPFVLALLLTFASFALAVLAQGFGVVEAIGAWGGRILSGEVTKEEAGFWKFLTFAMQMCLILVTGHALASTKPVGALIGRLASAPKSTAQAASMTAFAAMVAAFVNWGLGLIVGALLARQIGLSARERGVRIHYPLVAAAGYVGLMVWHGGLSGSAPFKMTQTKDVVEILGAERAAAVGTVGLDQTVFGSLNLVVTALLLVVVPLFFWLLAPKDPEHTVGVEAARFEETAEEEPSTAAGPVAFLERTPLLTLLTCTLGFAYLWIYLSAIGLLAIDINAIILIFLLAGLLLHGSPASYVRAVNEAVRGCGGIVLQFPFYAGIQAILQYSGLVKSMSDWIADNASAQTLPVFTFLSAGLVNLFVPSGGGQWGVQGPIVVDSAATLGAPMGASIMALAYGDQWTNMLQPFWALPLLSLTGLRARDIIGYTALVMLLSLPLFVVPMLLIR